MKKLNLLVVIFVILTPFSSYGDKPSVNLEDLTWQEAEKVLREYDVALIALGARTKEHGPHLLLKNDFLMAEYLKERVMVEVPVVVLPTLQYGYYPAFLEYPGSVSIQAKTFAQMIVDICRSIHGYGIDKFYVLNTGVSTLQPLAQAKEDLRENGVLLEYLNILEVDERLPSGLMKQEGGTHADEGETSMMLYIAPESVDMSKAVKDYDSRPDRRGLTRDPDGEGHFSPTGIWGDPTLASREKGRIIVENTVFAIIGQVRELIAKRVE